MCKETPMTGDTSVSIRPYAEGEMWIFESRLGDPNQMIYLNGPESKERIRKRDKVFLSMSALKRALSMGHIFPILKAGRATNVTIALSSLGLGTIQPGNTIHLLVCLQNSEYVSFTVKAS